MRESILDKLPSSYRALEQIIKMSNDQLIDAINYGRIRISSTEENIVSLNNDIRKNDGKVVKLLSQKERQSLYNGKVEKQARDKMRERAEKMGESVGDGDPAGVDASAGDVGSDGPAGRKADDRASGKADGEYVDDIKKALGILGVTYKAFYPRISADVIGIISRSLINRYHSDKNIGVTDRKRKLDDEMFSDVVWARDYLIGKWHS